MTWFKCRLEALSTEFAKKKNSQKTNKTPTEFDTSSSQVIYSINYCNHLVHKEEEVDGGIAMLDAKIQKDLSGRLNFTVYRKLTHIDQYLQFSNQPLQHKLGVIRTLYHSRDVSRISKIGASWPLAFRNRGQFSKMGANQFFMKIAPTVKCQINVPA